MLTVEQQIFNQIEKAQNILIVFPVDWDGDSVSAALTLFTYLKQQNKNIEIVSSAPNKDVTALSFLPNFLEIKNNLEHLRRFIVSLDISKTKVSQIKYVVEDNQLNFIVSPQDGWFEPSDVSSKAGEFRYDLIIIIGANDFESLGNVYDQNVEFFYKTPIINISQQAANEEFGQINLINLNCVAVSEIIYNLIKLDKKNKIDENLATGLLAGIIIKTRNFKTGNLTPETLMTTSELIGLGARRDEIINRLYRSRNLSDLKLWGKVLNNLRLENDNELAWSYLAKSDIQDINVNEHKLGDMVDELMSNLPDTKIIIVLVEDKIDNTKLFAFSLKNTNIIELFKIYKPEGTLKTISANIKLDLNTATTEVIKETKIKLDKLK